jgi:hypothetical protein
MSATLGRIVSWIIVRACVPVLGTALLLVIACPATQASAIKKLEHEVKAHVEDPLQAYFQQALRAHSLHVRVPASLRPLHPRAGLLAETPFIDYLRWRWGLNHERFARFHPHVAAMLLVDDRLRHTVVTLPLVTSGRPSSTTPNTPPHTINPGPQVIIPPAAPEPATGLMAIIMLGAVYWVRRYRAAQG